MPPKLLEALDKDKGGHPLPPINISIVMPSFPPLMAGLMQKREEEDETKKEMLKELRSISRNSSTNHPGGT